MRCRLAPTYAFYEHLGGQRVGEQQIKLGDEITAVEVVYGWQDITQFGDELEILGEERLKEGV